MSTAYERLDQAMRDLLESYLEIQDKLEDSHGDDDDSIAHGLIESFEAAIESGLEEHDLSTTAMATVLSHLTDALEQLDPSAFDDDENEDESPEDYDVEEMDDSDIDDIDLDEEDDEEEYEEED